MQRWWLIAVLAIGCAQDDEDTYGDEGGDRFPCGDGGSCAVDSEMCLVDDSNGCTICVPLPTACDPAATCGCLPAANDPAFGMSGCVDVGMCESDEGGLVITCADAANWGCG